MASNVTDPERSKGRTGSGKPWRLTIGVKFVSLIVLVTLLTGLVIGYTLIKTSSNSLREQVLHNNLSQADLTTSFASSYVKAVEAHVEVFSQRPDVTQAVIDNTEEKLQSTLANFVAIQTSLDSCGIYNPEGILQVHSMAAATTIGQSFADREWFQQTLATKSPYLGIPIISRTTGLPLAPFGVPILNESKQLIGVLGASISLNQLSAAIVDIDFGPETHASLIDRRNNGLVIADSDHRRILKPLTEQNEAVSRLLAGERASIEIPGSSGMELIGFAPVPNLTWSVMVATPSEVALSSINSLIQKTVLITFVIILLATIIGMSLMRGVNRPLRRLVEGTHQIGRGNLDYKIAIKGRDEIGVLSQAFYDMTEKLKNTLVSRDALTQEIGERKRVEQSLESLSSRWQGLLAAIPDIVMEVDNNKVYTWANKAGLDFFGEQVVGNGAALYFEGEQSTYDLVNPLFKGDENTFYLESWQRRKDGQKRLLAWWCRALKDESGSVRGALSTAQDITDRKNLEHEREIFIQELKEKSAELERFTYTISHDLKSPLVTIKTFLGYLKEDIKGINKARIEQDMLYMDGAAGKMGKLLDELLQMSRIGRVINPPTEVTFQELMREVLIQVAGRIEQGGVKVEIDEAPVTFKGDHSRLLEIWQNLVENAVKFMGEQSAPRIDIGVEDCDHQMVFYVRDNGIGIDPHYQPRLFNHFEKINPRTEGAGMGLAIVKRIVELYQGRIWVESAGLAQGSCFRFTLPGALKK